MVIVEYEVAAGLSLEVRVELAIDGIEFPQNS